jgi:citrate synthase
MAKTVIHNDLEAKWGDKDHLEVSKSKTFSQMIFEMLSEREATPQELAVFELILNLSIDHGPDAPSSSATIAAAKEGKGMGGSIGAGIAQINERHGGAIEPCMEILYKVNRGQVTVDSLVGEYLKEGKRMPGFGHRIYKDIDPRTQLIFKTLEENGFSKEYTQIAKDIEVELEKQKGQKLPINIDGGIAVVLCAFGWEAKLANAVFIIARTPGLCAHFLNNS